MLPTLEPEAPGIHAIFLSRQRRPPALRLLVGLLAVRFGGDRSPRDP